MGGLSKCDRKGVFKGCVEEGEEENMIMKIKLKLCIRKAPQSDAFFVLEKHLNLMHAKITG